MGVQGGRNRMTVKRKTRREAEGEGDEKVQNERRRGITRGPSSDKHQNDRVTCLARLNYKLAQPGNYTCCRDLRGRQGGATDHGTLARSPLLPPK